MKAYIRLMRPVHWIKNLIILLPLLCSGSILELSSLGKCILGMVSFSLISSAVYIINDICDRERDRLSTEKCGRPIASGAVSVRNAWVLCGVLFGLSVLACRFTCGTAPAGYGILLLYFLMNIAYSFDLKKIPLVDVAILAAGYLLRLLFGSVITDIELSNWLSLCIISGSFYMGLGKRRGEIRNQTESVRPVLKYYNYAFLDKNMYMFEGLSIMFYALWCTADSTQLRLGSDRLIWTVPLVILIFMKYSLNIEKNSSSDPVEVLLHDRVLILLCLVFAVVICGCIYLPLVL